MSCHILKTLHESMLAVNYGPAYITRAVSYTFKMLMTFTPVACIVNINYDTSVVIYGRNMFTIETTGVTEIHPFSLSLTKRPNKQNCCTLQVFRA